MKISLVIPTYNEERYIKKCLESIERQIQKPDEVIIVNNNSTDRTVEIAKKFNVKIINEKQQGISFARNRGFNETKYDIIARCDADCILPKNWVRHIKLSFENEQVDALLGPLYYYDLKIPTKKLFIALVNFLKVFLGHYPIIGPNFAITKKIWNKIKGDVCNDDKIGHEDIDLSIHINKAGGKIKYDQKFINTLSSRRLKNNPYSFFVEYPERCVRTIRNHK